MAFMTGNEFINALRIIRTRLGVAYSAKRYVPNSAKRITSTTPTISERQYRTKREGVSVEKAIAERKSGVRAYVSPAAHVRAQRAIERNRRNPIRTYVREKKAQGQHVTEREFEKNNKWYLDLIEKKSGVRWRLVDGEWRGEATALSRRR
jgi:hypothetical protein